MKLGLRVRARALWARLRGGELTAARAALSVAVGLAIGVTPLWGAHIFLVLLVCVPLKLDAPVAYLAANISMPFIAPFLTMAELEIGSFLLTGEPLPASLARVQAHGAGLFVKEVAAGTLVFSPAVALLGGALTYGIARLARKDDALRGDPRAALDDVASRYASGGKPAYHYVRSKLASDPVARRVLALGAQEPFGALLDVGCGRGQLALLLLTSGRATRVTGFDWDIAKVAAATRAAEAAPALPAHFHVRDLRDPPDSDVETALLIDVLHYLGNEDQDEVLRTAARRASRCVIVRELDPDRGLRSMLTRAQERVTTGLGYNRGARVNARPIRELVRVLEGEGFSVEVTPCWGATPLSNVLIVGRRAPT